MIFVVSLPSIESRYTGQWKEWVSKYAKDNPEKNIVLMGNDTEYRIPPTEFLSFRDYYSYVFPLLSSVVKEVSNGDIVFFMDGETAGVEAFEYLRKMEGINVEIRTFWHSGTYDTNDLTFKRHVNGADFERGWFNIADKIYVGSSFHKEMILKQRAIDDESKIIVSGNPLDVKELDAISKNKGSKHSIVFAGRLVSEKGYDIVKKLRAEKGLDILATMEHNFSKSEYYSILSNADVLFHPSKQDTFCIACMEAFGLGTPILVPDTPVYRSLIPSRYRYKDLDDIDWGGLSKLRSGYEKSLVAKYDYRIVMDEWFHE